MLHAVYSDDICVAKFHLVDLAGSERQKKTQAEGERLKEGQFTYCLVPVVGLLDQPSLQWNCGLMSPVRVWWVTLTECGSPQ